MTKYKKTKKGVISVIYGQQRSSSKIRGHRPPEYSNKDLQEWVMSQTLFHELYDEWVQSDYLKRLKPSVDRKHDDIHYCMNNIQLMTWGENNKKAARAAREGDLFTTHKKVFQYTLEGIFIRSFISQREASRDTGILQSSISSCCRGHEKYNHAGGYIWKFTKIKDETDGKEKK